jgi:hypothetical protein
MDYPFEESIKSLLDFCDEVVVADSSDGTDGTMEKLQKLMDKNSKLEVFHVEVPWDAPNHGIYDGVMKAVARSKCTGDYLWQMDVDEIAEPGIRPKIEDLLKQAEPFMDKAPIISLPVVEFWGSNGKVRIDVNPWKWRLSKNLPFITHGIPAQLRKEEDGLLYARHGTDGCDYVHNGTSEIVPFSNFVTAEVEQIRRAAVVDPAAALEYQNWLNMVIGHLPTVYHYSWYSIKSKILKFKHFWNGSWISLYNDKKPEGWNPFFANKTLDEVSDKEITDLALALERDCGGHVFHKPWDGTKTNHVHIETSTPKIMNQWCKRHKD